MHFDALIVGAGPAGSVAAQLLAQAGWRVALAEKTVFPRRKVCGEFVSATTLPILKTCGVGQAFSDAAGPVVTRLGIYTADIALTAPEEKLWGWALGREHLDLMLRDAAVATGAQLYQPVELTSFRREESGFSCLLGEEAVTARTVIAACGSWNSKGPFAVAPKAAPSDLFAFKAHFQESALPRGLMSLLAFPGGYGGLTHSDSGRTVLSCCIRRDVLAEVRNLYSGKAGEAVLAHIIATTRGVRETLGHAVLEDHILSTGPIRPGIRILHKDGIFFTGNLAGEAHPVIAEGISMAIQSSGLLAWLLINGRGEEYAAAWKRRFASRIRAASLFAHLAMNDAASMVAMGVFRAAPGLVSLGARFSGKSTPVGAPFL